MEKGIALALESVGLIRSYIQDFDFINDIDNDFDWLIYKLRELVPQLIKAKVDATIVKMFNEKIDFLLEVKKSANDEIKLKTLMTQREYIVKSLYDL